MKHTLALLTGLLVMVTGLVTSQATNLLFSGTFSATPDSDVSSLSGSFQFSFDDSVVTSGVEFFSPISLTSLSLTPNPLGVTPFNLMNVETLLRFDDGNLSAVWVGGAQDGVGSVTGSADDFVVHYFDPGALSSGATPFSVVASVASSPSTVGVDSSPSGSLAIIPEPSRALLSLLGLGVVLVRRRR